MQVIHVFERRTFAGGEYIEKDDAKLHLDNRDNQIELHLRTSKTGNPDIRENRSVTGMITSNELARKDIEYIIDITEKWLTSETRSSVTVNIGEISGTHGPYTRRDQFNELEMSIDTRGIWLGSGNAVGSGIFIPAATERRNGEDDDIYNIVRFKQVLEEFIYEYGTKQEEEPSDTKFLSLPESSIDDELRERCLPRFNQGDYSGTAKEAGQLLEERVREKGPETSSSDHGARLMTEMFKPKGGPLAFGENTNEKEGILHLYTGAIKAIWNPVHHRTPEPSKDRHLDTFDRQQAHDTICYVNLLLTFLGDNTE